MTSPAQLKYASSHEWVQDLGDGVFAVGITQRKVHRFRVFDSDESQPQGADAVAQIGLVKNL